MDVMPPVLAWRLHMHGFIQIRKRKISVRRKSCFPLRPGARSYTSGKHGFRRTPIFRLRIYMNPCMCGHQASTGGMTSIVRLFSLQEVRHAWSCALVVCYFRSIHTSKQIPHTHACSASGPDAHTPLRRRSPHRRRGRHRPPFMSLLFASPASRQEQTLPQHSRCGLLSHRFRATLQFGFKGLTWSKRTVRRFHTDQKPRGHEHSRLISHASRAAPLFGFWHRASLSCSEEGEKLRRRCGAIHAKTTKSPYPVKRVCAGITLGHIHLNAGE